MIARNGFCSFFYCLIVAFTWSRISCRPEVKLFDAFDNANGIETWNDVATEGKPEPEVEKIIFTERRNDSARPIVPKCCNLGFGFTFENKSRCIETENEFLPDFEDRPEYSEKAIRLPAIARYEYYIGDPCIDGKYILDAETYAYDNYSIYSNGTLLYVGELYNKEDFCVESVDDSLRVFICFGAGSVEPKNEFIYTLYAIGLLISVPFLIVTAVIYLSIDLLRDLRGKSLSCHVLCLATGYVFLALVQLASDELNEEVCIAAGFIIQFFFVAAFFWLNVICFDTWRCIKNDFICIDKPINLNSEKVTFCYYFIYGFYGPVILSIVSLIMDLEPAIPETYLKPNFGFRSCWFYSHEAAFPYFYGPVGVTVCINFLFFVLSTRKIYQIQKRKSEILYLNTSPASGPQEKPHSVKIYIKALQESIYLFCLMGISWTAEIVSWAIGGSQMIWLVTDVFNTLQGVMIFYLLVARPQRVRNQVKRRLLTTWKKIITCDFSHKEDGKPSTRRLRTNDNETTETCFISENN